MKTFRFFFTLCGLILTITAAAFAQPDSLWSRTYGGEGEDRCTSVLQASSGDYILGGVTWSYGVGGGDFWLVKTSMNGDSIWSRTFGGVGWDECTSIQQTSDGGYILGGWVSSEDPGDVDFDCWLVKTNAQGDSLWRRAYGGNNGESCYSVQQTTDGGYILGGTTTSYGAGSNDFWLVRVSSNGGRMWSQAFGGSSVDFCESVQQTADGGYILGGWTYSFGAGASDFWLVKTDTNGEEEWNRTFGGSGYDYCSSVQQIPDGGYILGGFIHLHMALVVTISG